MFYFSKASSPSPSDPGLRGLLSASYVLWREAACLQGVYMSVLSQWRVELFKQSLPVWASHDLLRQWGVEEIVSPGAHFHLCKRHSSVTSAPNCRGEWSNILTRKNRRHVLQLCEAFSQSGQSSLVTEVDPCRCSGIDPRFHFVKNVMFYSAAGSSENPNRICPMWVPNTDPAESSSSNKDIYLFCSFI